MCTRSEVRSECVNVVLVFDLLLERDLGHFVGFQLIRQVFDALLLLLHFSFEPQYFLLFFVAVGHESLQRSSHCRHTLLHFVDVLLALVQLLDPRQRLLLNSCLLRTVVLHRCRLKANEAESHGSESQACRFVRKGVRVCNSVALSRFFSVSLFLIINNHYN